MQKQYNTFWRRWAAGLLDGLIFLPLAFINTFIQSQAYLPVIITIIWQILYIFSRPVYTILMHGKYGQTVGKKATGVILLNIDETRIIGYKQAIIRESPSLIVLLVYLVFIIYQLLGYNISHSMSVLLMIFGSANSIWFLLEIISTLTNNKRRALHDFIAHSVVIRTEYMFLDEFPERPEQFVTEAAENKMHI